MSPRDALRLENRFSAGELVCARHGYGLGAAAAAPAWPGPIDGARGVADRGNARRGRRLRVVAITRAAIDCSYSVEECSSVFCECWCGAISLQRVHPHSWPIVHTLLASTHLALINPAASPAAMPIGAPSCSAAAFVAALYL